MFGLEFETERLLHFRLSVLMMAAAVNVFVSLSFLPSSSVYGKNSHQHGFPAFQRLLQVCVPPRIAWLIFESPPLIWSAYVYSTITTQIPMPNRILGSMFVLHYVYRDLVYSSLISKRAHPVPLLTSVSAFIFCNWNGYLQAQANFSFQTYPSDFWQSPQVWLGSVIFLIGFFGVIQSDFILCSLRRGSGDGHSSGYQIPYGGWFRYVSCPHYFCEIMEWVGYAIMSSLSRPVSHQHPMKPGTIPNGVAAWAFLAFTCANLIPRAASHHNYYLSHFKEEYPPLKRRAIIPFIL